MEENNNINNENNTAETVTPVEETPAKTNKKRSFGTVLIISVCVILAVMIGLYFAFPNKINSLFVKQSNKLSGLKWELDKSSDNDMCAQAVVVIYEDNDYTYSVANSCIANYKVVFTNGEKYTIGEALKNNKVTVEDLTSSGVEITKEGKMHTWSIDRSSDNETCAQAIVTIYEDNDYYYTVANSCVANYKVVLPDGSKLILKDALSQGKVTIQELIDQGITINKEGKMHTTWSIDRTSDGNMCAQSVVTIYEDNDYTYTVANSCIANYKVVLPDGTKLVLKDALSQGKVTIQDLINQGIAINKEGKMHTWTIDTNSDQMCTQVVTTVYEDDDYTYTVGNPCIASYKITFPDGTKLTIKEALAQGKVTVQELINKGINIEKQGKMHVW